MLFYYWRITSLVQAVEIVTMILFLFILLLIHLIPSCHAWRFQSHVFYISSGLLHKFVGFSSVFRFDLSKKHARAKYVISNDPITQFLVSKYVIKLAYLPGVVQRCKGSTLVAGAEVSTDADGDAACALRRCTIADAQLAGKYNGVTALGRR